MAKPYKPQAGGLAGRVLAFFQANQDEFLLSADIAVKFDAELDNVRSLLLPACRAGLLARVPMPWGSGAAYALGPASAPA